MLANRGRTGQAPARETLRILESEMGLPLPAAGHLVLARLMLSQGDDANIQTVTHWEYGDEHAALTPVECQTIANDIFDAYKNHVLSHHHQSVTLQEVQVTDLVSLTSNQASSTRAPAHSTTAGVTLPAGVCMMCTHRTALRGRSFRGRTYVSGFADDIVADPQHFSTAVVNAMNDAWNAFQVELSTADIPLFQCIVSYYSGTDATIPGRRPVAIRRDIPLHATVTSSLFSTRISTQRRRNR